MRYFTRIGHFSSESYNAGRLHEPDAYMGIVATTPVTGARRKAERIEWTGVGRRSDGRQPAELQKPAMSRA